MNRIFRNIGAALLAISALTASACDIFGELDHRDIQYNDQMCQPYKNGACS